MQRRFLAMVVSLGLAMVAAGAAEAGVEPSPFHLRVVKLQAVSSAVLGADTLLRELFTYHPPEPGTECDPPELSVPPEPCIPANAMAEELRSMAKHVQRLEEMVYETLDDSAAPEGKLVRELLVIAEEADALVDQVDEAGEFEDAKVANAMAKLRRNAQALANTASPLVDDAR
ncbi:MAG TPA: hypothetical protein VK997_07815 [Deferrisomatales bacterium]|nr:hypothetical protein [Deferrisomatales bacterium]